jgi:hypothetical protein
MFNRQQQQGVNLLPKKGHVVDLTTAFDKQNRTTPQLVKYSRKQSDTDRSSESVTIPVKPSNMSKGIIAGISSLSKAAGEVVGISNSPSTTVTLHLDKQTAAGAIPKIKQATLVLKKHAEDKPTQPPTSAPSANSYLTQSVADTPLSSQGDWDEDNEGDLLISLTQDGDYIQESAGCAGVPLVEDGLPRKNALEDMEVSTPGGVKRPAPNKAMTNKEKRERGGKIPKGAESSSGDEEATTVKKRPALPIKPTKGAPTAEDVVTPTTRPLPSFSADQQQTSHLEVIVNQMAGNIQQLSVNYGKLYDEFKRQEAELRQTKESLAAVRSDFDCNSSEQLTAYSNMAGKITYLKGVQDQQEKVAQSMQNRLVEAEKSIEGIHHTVAKITSKQEAMSAEWKRITSNLDHSVPSLQNDQSSSLFLGGLQNLRGWRNDYESDPLELVEELMQHLHIFYFMDRISMADNNARNSGDRLAARAVIITMRSPHHRREAIIKIKRWLNDQRHNGLEGVTVGDCFPNNMVLRARKLGKYAFEKKKQGHLHRFRVINRRGEAVLQISKKDKPFEDCHPTDDELEGHEQTTEDSQEQEMDTEENAEAGPQPSSNRGRGGRGATKGGRGAATGANSQKLGARASNNTNDKNNSNRGRTANTAASSRTVAASTANQSRGRPEQPRKNSWGSSSPGGWQEAGGASGGRAAGPGGQLPPPREG